MTTIEVYPSALPGQPMERHQVPDAGTLHDWLTASCPSYKPGPLQPICVFSGGVLLPPDTWTSVRLTGQTLELRPNPQDFGISLWLLGGLLLGAVAVMVLLRPNVPSMKSSLGARGQELSVVDLKANQPRLNGVIPEVSGRYKVFPDYLCQPRRYFKDIKTQAVDAMLCIGQGEFVINAEDIFIGETPLMALGETALYEIFEPGETVSGNQSHRNWYNAPEVGASTGAAGLRLTPGLSGTPKATASSYYVNGDSINFTTGSGIAPQDWEVGNIVRINMKTRTITVVDGGGSPFFPVRDKLRGSFADLSLVAGNEILITEGVNAGRYKVITVSTVPFPGTASYIHGVIVSELSFSGTPVTFVVGGQTVTIDEDYSDVSLLVADIDAQTGGYHITESGGMIRVTEQTPFSGLPISLSGDYSRIFGVTPTFFTGTPTSSTDELTLDKWVTNQTGTEEDGTPIYTSGWELAGSMTPGVTYNTDVQEPRVRVVGGVSEYLNTEYRILVLVAGTIPDGSGGTVAGTVGFEFQRLNPDGTDDVSWTGFYQNGATPYVTIEFDSSQVVGGWVGPFRATPSAESAQILEFDIFAPSGLAYISDEGNIGAITREFELEWRTGGGVWTSVPYSVSNGSKDQLGWTFSLTLPASYSSLDVRIRRKGAESEALKILDRLEWYGLRVLLPAPASYAGATTMAVTIQGSDKIAARTENQINAIVTRKLNGVATRSIDDWVRYVCSSVGYASTDINETELTALGALWDSRGDYYDSVLIDQTTVKEELGQALRVGFAELAIDQGKIRPVRDAVRTVFEHLYTPQNMTSVLRRGFTSYDPDDYDGVDVEYTSSTTWEQEIVQCRLPGDTGIRIEKLRLGGITDGTRAWRVGMRQRRMQKYRRKSYSFETELDAMNSRYLSYCALADDIPGYGQSALLASITPVTDGQLLTSTEPLVWVDGESHVVALRRQDGTLSGPHAATRVDEYRLTIPSIDFVPTTGGAVEITHVLFGTVSRWSYPALITEIVPSGGSVEVSAVNYDVRVYADDDNSPS